VAAVSTEAAAPLSQPDKADQLHLIIIQEAILFRQGEVLEAAQEIPVLIIQAAGLPPPAVPDHTQEAIHQVLLPQALLPEVLLPVVLPQAAENPGPHQAAHQAHHPAADDKDPC